MSTTPSFIVLYLSDPISTLSLCKASSSLTKTNPRRTSFVSTMLKRPNKKKATSAAVVDLTGSPGSLKYDSEPEVEVVEVQQPSNIRHRLKRTHAIQLDSHDDVEVVEVDPLPAAAKKHNGTSRKIAHQPIKVRKRTFGCSICLEDDILASYGYTLPCDHRFCLPCLSALIKTNISAPGSAASSNIVCPADKCTTSVSLTDVQYILRSDPKTFQLYAQVANMTTLESEATDTSSHTRRCPAANCTFIFVYKPGNGAEGRRFKCPDCRARFCLQCGANGGKVGPAHKGVSCADRKEQLDQEEKERKKFEAWKKENSQADRRFTELLSKEQRAGKTLPCPKCGIPITKNGGCNHMHCQACKTDFNWKGKA